MGPLTNSETESALETVLNFGRSIDWPDLISQGGPIIWVFLLASAAALATFIDRLLHYHRAQINSVEFLNGVRNVLKQKNIVEVLAICDATPGPVARLVKTAVLHREQGRERVREALEESGLTEVPRLEERLNFLATIAQVAPLVGLFGTVIGFMEVFLAMEEIGPAFTFTQVAGGLGHAIFSTAAGLAVSIPSYLGYNYLVGRVGSIILDMEKASTEILNTLSDAQEDEIGSEDGSREVS